MSVDHDTWFVIPKEHFTEGQFAKAMDSLRDLPDSMIPPYDPPDPDAPMFTTGSFPSPVIDGIDTYGFYAISNTDEVEEYGSSLPFGVLVLGTEGKKFYDNDLLSEAYAEVLGRIFVGLRAVYAAGGTEYDMADANSIGTLLEITGGIHILSKELVDAIGGDLIAESGHVTMVDTATIVRTNEEDIYGGAFGKLGSVLDRVGEILGIEQEEAPEPPPSSYTPAFPDRFVGDTRVEYKGLEERYKDHVSDEPVKIDVRGISPPAAPEARCKELQYSSYAPFFLLYCREVTDIRSASGSFLRDLLTFDASEQAPEDGYWLRPDRVDQLVDRLMQGEMTIFKFDRSFTIPPTHRQTMQVYMAVVGGLPDLASYGPIYEREGATSVFIGISWGNLGTLNGIEGLTLTLQVLALFAKHFRPVLGFGLPGFKGFMDLANEGVSPESQIWPVNVFDLDILGHEFEARLRDFYVKNADRWMLQDLYRRTVALMAYDPENRDMSLYEMATRSIFGDLPDLSGPINSYLLGSYLDLGGGGQ